MTWRFSGQTALLVVFSITYGFSAKWGQVGCMPPECDINGTLIRLVRHGRDPLQELKVQSLALDAGFIFELLAGRRDIGDVIGGLLSVALVTSDG